MTVRELIAKLSTFNPNLDCMMLHPEWGEDELVANARVCYRAEPFTNDETLIVRIE